MNLNNSSGEHFAPLNPMRPLPVIFVKDDEAQAMSSYGSAIQDATSSEDCAYYTDAHINVAHGNLRNRFKHLEANALIETLTSRQLQDILRLQFVSALDFVGRATMFARGSSLNSVEVVSSLEAGLPPARLTTNLAQSAFLLLLEEANMKPVRNASRTRVKVSRTIDFGESRAAVITAKTDGLTVESTTGYHVDVKMRQSGFVVLDENIDEETQQSFKILGNMRWGDEITDEMVVAHRERAYSAVLENDIYHPTVSTVYLAHAVKAASQL